jgi:hypothetical protein
MVTVFRLINLTILPFWALMILLPHWRWTFRIMRSPIVSIAPALIYAFLLLPRLATVWPVISHPAVPAVAALLGSPEGAAIAWAHFVCFDLFVGRTMYLESRELGVNALLMAPILFCTLMIAPVGFLLYLPIRLTCRAIKAAHAS